MNDEIELTEMPAEAPQGGFRAAMASIKKIEKRFSLDGKASMGEYWVTFLLRWLPLALVSGGLMYVAGHMDMSATSDNKMISSLFTTGWLGIQILIPALFTIANLEMFPVTVRRLRDAKVCVGLAAFMIPAVVFFTAVAAVYPWLVCISALILLVPGILPSKAGADDANAAGVVTKTKMCYLAAVLFIISAAALGIATESLIIRFGVEKMAKKYSKKNGDSSASTGERESGSSYDGQKKKVACIQNMKEIQGAGEMCLMKGKKPTPENLYGRNGYILTEPHCPLGGRYEVSVDEENGGGVKVTCPHADEGHVLH